MVDNADDADNDDDAADDQSCEISIFLHSAKIQNNFYPKKYAEIATNLGLNLIQPAGLRAESARAVTGRRCPHSGMG